LPICWPVGIDIPLRVVAFDTNDGLVRDITDH
jgi:hypothetical protein